MSSKTGTRFIWKGPHTSIELWPVPEAGDKPAKPVEPIYSGPVAPGAEIPVPLPEDHDQVKGWLAFGLIAPVPVEAPKPRTKETGLLPVKENADG